MDLLTSKKNPVLTKSATSYLKTWERRSLLPVEFVRARLLDAGFEPLDAWLSFHERYAGCVEEIANDKAILGLVHASPQWLEPNEVEVEFENDGITRYITCADVHPSYTYQLDPSKSISSARPSGGSSLATGRRGF